MYIDGPIKSARNQDMLTTCYTGGV